VGAGSALDSIDEVTAALRGKLGEALASVEKDSAPLPQVTTKNLDALRAYALGQESYARGGFAEAATLYQRATQLDPNFALAYLGSVRASMASIDANAAIPYLKTAIALRDRLPPREGLYLDAWAAEFAPGRNAPEKWKLLAQMYPEYFAGSANYAAALMDEGRYSEAEKYAQATTAPQNALRGIGFDYLGRATLGQEKYDDAQKSFRQAMGLGFASSARRLADVHAARGQFTDARKHLAHPEIGPEVRYIEEVSLAIDQGDFGRAEAMADKAYSDDAAGKDLTRRVFGLVRGVVLMLGGEKDRARSRFAEAMNASIEAISNPQIGNRTDDAYIALAIAYAAQRNGDDSLAKRALLELESYKEIFEEPNVRAGLERSSGQHEAAISRLRGLLTGSELPQTHAALLETYYLAGRFEEVVTEARWLAAHRGRAYIETNGGQAMQSLNVADTRLARLRAAEALLKLSRPKEAQQEVRAFLDAWPPGVMPAYLRLRADAIFPASKQ